MLESVVEVSDRVSDRVSGRVSDRVSVDVFDIYSSQLWCRQYTFESGVSLRDNARQCQSQFV